MTARAIALTLVAVAFVTAVPPDVAARGARAALPRRIGACAVTRIKAVETRLQEGDTNKPIPDSGSAVEFTNGGYQVSYHQVPAIDQSRPGDRVRMCLVLIPHPCPPGDVRGRLARVWLCLDFVIAICKYSASCERPRLGWARGVDWVADGA